MDENTFLDQPTPLLAGLRSLPVELILEILDYASRGGERRKALLELMVVCKAFTAPAVLLLHKSVVLRTADQAEGLLQSLKRAPSPSRLASSTKHLAITYQADSSPLVEGSISASSALPILFLLDNLRYLDVDAGDEGLKAVRQVLASGGGEMANLRGLKTSKVRWDKLVEMLVKTHKLRRLDVKELYHAEPAGEDADTDGEDASPAPTETGQEDATASASPAPTVTDSEDDEDDVAFRIPTLARPPSPTLPAPLVLPTFPQSPLTHLTLRSPNIPDELFLSLLSASYRTLSSLALIEATCFSRLALVVGLRSVRNLSDLELSGCRFSPVDAQTLSPQQGLPQRPLNSPPNALTPLPSLLLPSSDSPSITLSFPLSPSFCLSSARVTGPELIAPLDYLPRLLPFLHSLTLSSDDLLNPFDPDALAKVVGALPLQYLTLDIARPRIEVPQLVEAVKRAEGRIDAVAVGKRMRWTQEMLDEAKKACDGVGVLLSGEVVEERLRL